MNEWKKSSLREDAACVEVRPGFESDYPSVTVRDSKDPDGPRLRFHVDEWRAFVAGVKAGEFDDV